MKLVTHLHAEQELAQLDARFTHWRQHRTTPAEPIPQALWDHAVALTAVLPRSRVARRLRLSGQALKQHCAAQHTTPSAKVHPTSVDFVELTAPPSWPLATLSVEIDLQRADGTRLRIHCHEPQPPLEALVRTFLETP
jgi:hypothetical protein